MEVILAALVALIAGATAVHLMRRSELKARDVELQAAREALASKSETLAGALAERDAIENQLKQLATDRETLKEAFTAISSDQLKANRDELLKQASERFEKTEERHKNELEKRHEAIRTQFEGVGQNLEKFKELQRGIEERRDKDFGKLNQQLGALHQQTENLGKSTTGLSTALKGSSQSRGKWGEMALRNIVEAAGMTEHCDFMEQTSDESGSRPDLIVKLPGETRIPIDAKIPYSDYERMVEEEDPAARKLHLKKHGDTMRRTMLDLAKRKYHDELEGEIDFTVMFVPIESVASAAFEARPDLQSEAMKNRVLITTPVTLIALLLTVGLYWKQEKMAQNAQEIWDEASELHRRLAVFHGHLGKVGSGLTTAIKSFNSAVGSYETRVMPQGRRIEELSGTQDPAARLPDSPNQIETQARELSALALGDEAEDGGNEEAS
jgi:DNA recombination protein RmuC